MEETAVRRSAKRLIKDLYHQVSEECSDEELCVAMGAIAKYDKHSYREEDLMNYDEALKELGLGNNRAKLNELAKLYGIKNQKLKNMHVGFRREDILRLKEELDK